MEDPFPDCSPTNARSLLLTTEQEQKQDKGFKEKYSTFNSQAQTSLLAKQVLDLEQGTLKMFPLQGCMRSHGLVDCQDP